MAEPSTEPEVEYPLSETTAESEVEPEAYAEPETEYQAAGEPEAEGSNAEFYANIVAYSLIIFLILLLNAIILAALFKGKLYKRNAVNVYLISLLVSRMSIGVLVVPARITGLFSEAYLGSFLCKICHYFGLGSAASSVGSTTAIAIVKYEEVVLKKGNGRIGLKRALRDAGIIWLVGHLYAIRAPVMNDLTVFNDRVACTVTANYRNVNQYFTFLDMAVLFLTPMVIVIFCYVKLVLFLSEHDDDRKSPPMTSEQREDEGQMEKGKAPSPIVVKESEEKADTVSGDDASLSKNDEKDKKIAGNKPQKRSSIYMVMIVMILFVVCTIMPYIPRLYGYWEDDPIDNFGLFETVCYQISYSNAWINAIVIFIFRQDIRNSARAMFRCSAKVDPK